MAFGGFDDRGEARPMAEINTTPLVDVMLVLLVIFIITAPLLTHAIRLDLPDVDSKPSVETPTTVTVSIAPDGALYWNNDAIGDLASLKLRLAAAAGTRPRPEIQLRADRETATSDSPKWYRSFSKAVSDRSD
ncbi:MAG: biopolymer transporter ExbD [Burkholderiaceae bacterium]